MGLSDIVGKKPGLSSIAAAARAAPAVPIAPAPGNFATAVLECELNAFRNGYEDFHALALCEEIERCRAGDLGLSVRLIALAETLHMRIRRRRAGQR